MAMVKGVVFKTNSTNTHKGGKKGKRRSNRSKIREERPSGRAGVASI
jgi:hypothetical protein